MNAPDGKAAAGSATHDLAFTMTALLRAEPHLCNVLTHISSADWRMLERTLKIIFEPHTAPKKLDHVARNILQLVCDDRGVTGPLMRAFFFEAIVRVAGKAEKRRLEAKIQRLRMRISHEPRQPRREGRPRRKQHTPLTAGVAPPLAPTAQPGRTAGVAS